MIAMRLAAKIPMLALALGTMALPAAMAQDALPTQEATDALRHYLFVDCEVGEEGSALRGLMLHAESLEPELGRLLLEGPPGPMLDEVTAALVDEWGRREAFLASNPRLGLDPDLLLAVTSLSRADFIGQGLQRFDLMCRERAVVALAAIGTPSALRILRQALPVVNDGARDLIVATLKRSRSFGSQPPRSYRGRGSLAGGRRTETD
jgi:hypothetical protein